jgi:hypothetical protein
VVDAAAQADRAQRALHAAVQFVNADGDSVNLPENPSRVFPVVVTLEDLAVVTTAIWELAADGILPKEIAFPWAVSLYELELLCDLVEYPAELVHFLTRRARLNELQRITAHDELDWWMYYLLRGLYFEDVLDDPEAPDVIQLLSFTDDLDAYFLWKRGDRRKRARRPRQHFHKDLRALLDLLQRERRPGYIEASVALLEMGDEGREELVRAFRQLRQKTARDGKHHNLSLLSAGAQSLGISFMTEPGQDVRDLAGRLGTFCTAKKYQSRFERWVGFGWCAGTRRLVDAGVVLYGPWAEDPALDELLLEMGLAPSASVQPTPGELPWKEVRKQLRS